MRIFQILLIFFILTNNFSCKFIKNYYLAKEYGMELSDSTLEDTTETDITNNQNASGKKAELLSAFFGLDNALPRFSDLVICEDAAGKDGMPVIFSTEINVDSLQAGDFQVITASGKTGKNTCVTLAPADDIGELRTALLIGDFGNKDDQPIKVKIIGNILSKDKSMNYKGAFVNVTPLEQGPGIVLAEIVPENEWELGKEATEIPWGGGSGCPRGTLNVVRVTWNGGVTKPGGDEINDYERLKYQITLKKNDGTLEKVNPFAIADLGDGDNNHELCLDETGKPVSVYFPAGFVTDPREDLNQETEIKIFY